MFCSPVPKDGVNVNERAFDVTPFPLNRTVFCSFRPFLYPQWTQLCDWSYIIFACCSDVDNSGSPVRARKNLLNSTQMPMPSWVARITIRTKSSGAMLRFSSTHLFRVFRVDRYCFINLLQHLVTRLCVNHHLFLGLNAGSSMTMGASCPPIWAYWKWFGVKT